MIVTNYTVNSIDWCFLLFGTCKRSSIHIHLYIIQEMCGLNWVSVFENLIDIVSVFKPCSNSSDLGIQRKCFNLAKFDES